MLNRWKIWHSFPNRSRHVSLHFLQWVKKTQYLNCTSKLCSNAFKIFGERKVILFFLEVLSRKQLGWRNWVYLRGRVLFLEWDIKYKGPHWSNLYHSLQGPVSTSLGISSTTPPQPTQGHSCPLQPPMPMAFATLFSPGSCLGFWIPWDRASNEEANTKQ